jgi:hypothetical protein
VHDAASEQPTALMGLWRQPIHHQRQTGRKSSAWYLPVLRHVLVLASVGQQVKCTCMQHHNRPLTSVRMRCAVPVCRPRCLWFRQRLCIAHHPAPVALLRLVSFLARQLPSRQAAQPVHSHRSASSGRKATELLICRITPDSSLRICCGSFSCCLQSCTSQQHAGHT